MSTNPTDPTGETCAHCGEVRPRHFFGCAFPDGQRAGVEMTERRIAEWHRARGDAHKAKAIELRESGSMDRALTFNSLATMHHHAADDIERGEHRG